MKLPYTDKDHFLHGALSIAQPSFFNVKNVLCLILGAGLKRFLSIFKLAEESRQIFFSKCNIWDSGPRCYLLGPVGKGSEDNQHHTFLERTDRICKHLFPVVVVFQYMSHKYTIRI